jgi:hypothetical protein
LDAGRLQASHPPKEALDRKATDTLNWSKEAPETGGREKTQALAWGCLILEAQG